MLFQLLKQQYPNAEIIPNYYYSKSSLDEETLQEKKEGYEYDYIIKSSNPKEIVVVELKGYHAKYNIPLGDYETKNTVKWFFSKTLPFLKDRFTKDISEEYVYKGSYITSSNYEDDAIEYLNIINEGKLKPKKLDVYYDRNKLLELFEENGFKSLKSIIEKYY